MKIIIQRYSTDEERQAFKAAFLAGQNKGLVDALGKSAGRRTASPVTGSVGQQLAYISVSEDRNRPPDSLRRKPPGSESVKQPGTPPARRLQLDGRRNQL